MGRTKTKDLIKREFYWQNMTGRLDTYLKECRECQLAKQPVNSKVGTYSVESPVKPWEKVYVNIYGSLLQSKRGNNAF
ncbi:hypothetical protein PR048_026672 [Dryococelus australis]|uniref:Integrase zinc-binding domain-containing protein n=1 Tax=Dryococelus australis TaxID=614101 RepID=A0ABQ9GM04_9NEOP|nr:hypothetical protein PR048_026672 [Dryococelus australis]